MKKDIDDEFRKDTHRLEVGKTTSGWTDAGREAIERAVGQLIAAGVLAQCPFCGIVTGIEESHECPIFLFKQVGVIGRQP